MAEEEKLDESQNMSFWDHLEALRQGLFRVVIALLAAFVVLFFRWQLLAAQETEYEDCRARG